MLSSFWKKKENYFKNLNSFEDIVKFLNLKNREIRIDTLTPATADNIDTLIRFWNIEDEELNRAFAEREPIKLYINSLGGSIDAAMSIVDSISMSRTPIYTFNIGTVQKESFLIYIAGHKRLAYVNSTFMYSDSMLSKFNENEEINESSFYSKDNAWIGIAKNIKLLFLDKVNITEAQYDKHNKKEWWFTADDALKLHICNEISRKHFHYVKSKELV